MSYFQQFSILFRLQTRDLVRAEKACRSTLTWHPAVRAFELILRRCRHLPFLFLFFFEGTSYGFCSTLSQEKELCDSLALVFQ